MTTETLSRPVTPSRVPSVPARSESPTKKVSLAPVQPVTIPQFPTELPPAELLLLKEHLAVGITLDR